MTADDFLVWAMEQSESRRYELHQGQPVLKERDRVGQARSKLRFLCRFAETIEAAGLSCEVFGDGMAVRIDTNTVVEPDMMVRCGERLGDDVVVVEDPLIVVEVISPSSARRDTVNKLEAYFSLPSVRHFLIVRTDHPVIIHHQRDAAGVITTRIIHEGVITLDPPGLTVTGLFGD